MCSDLQVIVWVLTMEGVCFQIADYDQKAEDAVDYEDIQEQYEGPEVQIAQQEMQFYAQVAIAGVPKIQEDNYDEDEDFDSAEQPSETQPESPSIVPGMIFQPPC